MSTLKVIATPILSLSPHPNADRLELAQVLGWQCVVPRDRYVPGEVVIYIPVDGVLPEALSDKLGVTKYLSRGRVRAAQLRGVVSYGLVMPNEEGFEAGQDVTAHFGIEKFEPPITLSGGEVEAPHPLLTHYTDIENIKNYNDLMEPGEEVVATEKVHGTNCVHALIIEEDGREVFMASSHRHRRREDPESTYWRTFDDRTKALLREAVVGHRAALLFKEVYGGKIQNLNYGLENQVADVAFDLQIEGRYMDYDDFVALCGRHGVPVAPVLYRGPFDRGALDAIVNGPGVSTQVGQRHHIMEGVVIKPVRERWNPVTGRTILKWISDAYALDKNATDFH